MEGKVNQKSIKKRNPRWNASGHRFFYDFGGFWWPSWRNLGAKTRPTWSKEAIPKSIIFLMPLEIDIFGICNDLGYQNEGMLAPKSDGKSMLTSKGRCSKKYCKTNIILMIFAAQGVEIGRENRSKINEKSKSKMECLWVAFFLRFWWILNAKLDCKIHPNRSDLARRGVMARRGEAWRGEAWRGVA